MHPRDLLSLEAQQEIVAVIQDIERQSSCEIRVHIENKHKGAVKSRAIEVFEQLEMHQTALKNGILFYLAIDSKSFYILGDRAINKVVKEDFWEKVTQHVILHFKKGAYKEGLKVGIERCAEQLIHHFPIQHDDINELPDEISFGA